MLQREQRCQVGQVGRGRPGRHGGGWACRRGSRIHAQQGHRLQRLHEGALRGCSSVGAAGRRWASSWGQRGRAQSGRLPACGSPASPPRPLTLLAVLVVVGAVLHQVELFDGDAADVHGALGHRPLRVLQQRERHKAEGAAAEGVLALGEVDICTEDQPSSQRGCEADSLAATASGGRSTRGAGGGPHL